MLPCLHTGDSHPCHEQGKPLQGQSWAAAERGRTHLIVIASAEEDVVGGGMPLDEADAPAVPIQLQDSLRHVPLQASLGDLPDPHLRDGVGIRMVWEPQEDPDTHPGGL